MSETAPGPADRNRRRWSLAKTGGLLAAGALTGAVLTAAIPAVADSSSGSSSDSEATSEPTPGTGSQGTPDTQGNREDCPPGEAGRNREHRRDMAPDQDDGSTPDQQTPRAPERTPSSAQAASGGWRT